MEEIQITQGVVKLRKPTAGIRNEALMKAETPNGIMGIKFLMELLPRCVIEHPFGAKPNAQALDDLSLEDYDKLLNALGKIMELSIPKGDVVKKLETSSSTENPQTVSG